MGVSSCSIDRRYGVNMGRRKAEMRTFAEIVPSHRSVPRHLNLGSNLFFFPPSPLFLPF